MNHNQPSIQPSIQPLQVGLFLLRASVFLVLFMWTLNKFLNPEHAAAVFAKFYLIDGLSAQLAYGVGALQALVIFSFLYGIKKQYSYGIVFLMHLVSTVSAFDRYFDPWSSPNLLFFAAIPMLAAIAMLYLLRKEDTLFTIKKYE